MTYPLFVKAFQDQDRLINDFTSLSEVYCQGFLTLGSWERSPTPHRALIFRITSNQDFLIKDRKSANSKIV